jgi:hypothetical protein
MSEKNDTVEYQLTDPEREALTDTAVLPRTRGTRPRWWRRGR